MNPRLLATHILLNVIEDQHSLSDSLAQALPKLKDPRDRAFVQALCFGVCRSYFRLDEIAKKLLQKPLKENDQDIYLLILIGLYQLIEMRLPDYAAVSETVEVAKSLKKIWAKNLINAVLRNYQRQQARFPQSHYSHPNWMIEKLQHDWPNDWQSILDANNQHPPLALRVNQKKLSREEYINKNLHNFETSPLLEGVAEPEHRGGIFPIPETLSGIYLETPMDVHDIPGFMQGELSVQDGAAQLAAELLQVAPEQLVLDACAAPGGKTSHILEITNDIELIALDDDAHRLNVVKENLKRLQLSAKYICADAGDPKVWWDKKPFDRILLDAPCSAMGVIRRHPDIKLLRRASDIPNLAKEQSRLLNALWPLLKPNGLLVYATCSVFPDENEQVIQAFLEEHPEAKEEKIKAGWGVSCIVGRQILPGMHGMDGFYYACLRK